MQLRLFSRLGDRCKFVCAQLCGIAQGCPLSGMLWALRMGPLLRRADDELGRDAGRSAVLRACADDLGLVIYALRHLAHLRGAFLATSSLANLRLQPRKCVAVPLWAAPSVDLIAYVSSALAQMQEVGARLIPAATLARH